MRRAYAKPPTQLRPAARPHRAAAFSIAAAAAAALGLACGGNDGKPASAATTPAGPPVAVIGGAPVFASEIAAELRRGRRSAREALDAIVDFELLASAAARAIPADDPDVEQARRGAMVQRLLERELEPRLDRSAIPETELRAVYEKARSAFVHPRLVEIAILSIYTGARMKDEPRARALDAARELDAAIRLRAGTAADTTADTTTDALEALAKEPLWRERRVKYARLWQALDEPFEAEVGRAVAALSHPGDTTPLITSGSGYHIARYIAERPPENITFEQAEPSLRAQIHERWRQAAFIRLTDQLAGAHQIEAFPDQLQDRSAGQQ